METLVMTQKVNARRQVVIDLPQYYGTRTIMNIKQQQIVHELFDAIQAQFPEITLLNVSSSPENPQDIWVNVTAPNDDAREGALLDIASERSLDILLEHGYSILIMPEHRSAIAA